MYRKLTLYQEKLLTSLVELYERSKTYNGSNQVTQSFSRTPSQIFKEYDSDYTDYDLVQDFENQMFELEEKGLITIERRNGVIKKLYANPDKWNLYNSLLNRIDKNALIQRELSFYRSSMGVHDWIDTFCQEQIGRLSSGKKAVYPIEETKILLQLLKTVLENKEELLERELSILFFKDSKTFEKSYRSRLCSWLKKYGAFEELLEGIDDKREIEHILLGEYHIYANPSYLYFKGNAVICFDNGNTINVTQEFPLAFSSVVLEHIVKIEILAPAVMTIENLTSFNRTLDKHFFCIFLSGYHNSSKQKLLRKIYAQNKNLSWYHFGDLDPDGFYIIEHLIKRTGIPFHTYHMSLELLKKYKPYTKPLEANDKTKALSLIASGKYVELMEYMLANNSKLEQEIISLDGTGGRFSVPF